MLQFTTYSFYKSIFVIPVAFSKEHKKMLAHCKEMLEYQNGHMGIHPKFNKLITSLRTAVEKGDGLPSHDGLPRCFQVVLAVLALIMYF